MSFENLLSPTICLVEAVRSAEPPMILLVASPIFFNAFDPAILVANAFLSDLKSILISLDTNKSQFFLKSLSDSYFLLKVFVHSENVLLSFFLFSSK